MKSIETTDNAEDGYPYRPAEAKKLVNVLNAIHHNNSFQIETNDIWNYSVVVMYNSEYEVLGYVVKNLFEEIKTI